MPTELPAEANALFEEFRKITKRVLQNRPVSEKKSKINEYIILLTHTFNDLIVYVNRDDKLVPSEQYQDLVKRFVKCKDDLHKCGEKLKYKFELNDSLQSLPEPIFDDSDSEPICDDSDSEFSDANTDPPEAKTSITSNNPDFKPTVNADSAAIDSSNTTLNSTVIMATIEQKRNFISMCASTIRNNYDGNPLGLESFIDKINLIEEFTDNNLMPTFLRFIISKLEGKARESVPTNASSIDIIKVNLRNRIKPENSKVVKGKLACLNVVNGNISDFAKQMEELANAFERSLVVEGITHEKAHEMAIEETVSTCRANAKSDLVKSILASSKFDDPKDVVAKLIIEQTNEVNERKVMHFNANVDRSYGNTRSSNNFRSRHNFSQQNRNNFRRNNNFQRVNTHRGYNYNNNNSNYLRNDYHSRNDNFNNYRGNSRRSEQFNNNQFNTSGSNGRFRNRSNQPNNNGQAVVCSLNSEGHQQEETLSEAN